MLTTTALFRTPETTVTTDGAIGITTEAVRFRLRSLLPWSWFSDVASIRDALLAGSASVLSPIASFIVYTKRQARLATTTGALLDLAALDFLGLRLRRRADELDSSFQLRIRKEVVRPRVTRQAISDAVQDLTGYAPDIWEPWHPGDCGAIGYGFAFAGGTTQPAQIGGWGDAIGGVGVGGFAFLIPTPGPSGSEGAGCFGSLELPNQMFIRVHREPDPIAEAEGYGGLSQTGRLGGGQDGTPAISGLDGTLGGYGAGAGFALMVPNGPTQAASGVGAYAPGSLTSQTDAEIYQRISETVAAGIIAWTAIETDRA